MVGQSAAVMSCWAEDAQGLGLDPEKDVTWITLGGGSDTRLAALINGNLAGSNIQARHITQLEAAGGTVAYNKSRTIAQDGYRCHGRLI